MKREPLAARIQRRGFPIGIYVYRKGPYGETTSRLAYEDELSPADIELYARENNGAYPGFPNPIYQLTGPGVAISEAREREIEQAEAEAQENLRQTLNPEMAQNNPVESSDSADDDAKRAPAEFSLPPDEALQPTQEEPLSPAGASLEFDRESSPPDFSRHARRCIVCAHPDRDAIEGDFIRWASPSQIARTYGIADRASIYRHAHSTKLFERRRREVPRVLESILENVEHCPPERYDTTIRAARLYTRLDDSGAWVEPPRTTYFIAGPPPHLGGTALEPPAPRKTRSSKTKRFLTATGPHSKKRLKP